MKKILAITFISTIVGAVQVDIGEFVQPISLGYQGLKNQISVEDRERAIEQKAPLAQEIFDRSLHILRETSAEQLEQDGLMGISKKVFAQSSQEARNWCVYCYLTP